MWYQTKSEKKIITWANFYKDKETLELRAVITVTRWDLSFKYFLKNDQLKSDWFFGQDLSKNSMENLKKIAENLIWFSIIEKTVIEADFKEVLSKKDTVQ